MTIKSKIATKIIKMTEVCKVCGSTNIEDNCKFVICGKSFERYCDKCGWKIIGEIEDDKIIIIYDNSNILMK